MICCVRFSFVVSVVALCWGCAAHTNLTPVGSGQLKANLSVGGPIVEAFDTHIPVPYSTAGVDYGLTARLDLNCNLHLLPFAYRLAAADVGLTWFPVLIKARWPTLGIQPGVFVLASLKKGMSEYFRLYPLVSSSAAWRLGSGMVYSGFNIVLPFSKADYDEEAASFIFSPFIGYRWRLGARMALFTEIKLHGANIRSDQLVPGYSAIGKHGAISTLFAFQRSF